MDDILSEDELNSLLDSIEDESPAGKRPKRIVDYDFARPDKLNPEQIRSLQRMHENVATDVEGALSRLLRVPVEVSLISVGQLTFDVFRNSLANPTVVQVLAMPPAREAGVLTCDIKLSFSLIDRLLGGAGGTIDVIRPLTTVEESLLDNVTEILLARLSNGWKRIQEFDFKIIERESDPQFLQVIPAAEMVLVATFGISAPNNVVEAGEMCICIPFISLEGAIGKLSAGSAFADISRPQTEAERLHVDRVISQTTLPLVAELGRTTLSIGDILALKNGDVLVLAQPVNRPLAADVGGRRKLFGHAGRIGRKLGFAVDEVKPGASGEGEKYHG